MVGRAENVDLLPKWTQSKKAVLLMCYSRLLREATLGGLLHILIRVSAAYCGKLTVLKVQWGFCNKFNLGFERTFKLKHRSTVR